MDLDADYVSVVNAAREQVSGMWLDEPEPEDLSHASSSSMSPGQQQQALDPSLVLVLGKPIVCVLLE